MSSRFRRSCAADLKLGPDAELAADTPLVGGEMDLDSLDILLLVSSLEKQFGIQIPSEAVGRWVFQDIATLARYVRENQSTLAAAAARPAGEGDARQPDFLSKLPHGPEFRFISLVGEVRPGERATAVWGVDGSEHFFAGHFRGTPSSPASSWARPSPRPPACAHPTTPLNQAIPPAASWPKLTCGLIIPPSRPPRSG